MSKEMTVEKAKELCILAHKGQFRKGTPLSAEFTLEWANSLRENPDEKYHLLSNGEYAWYDGSRHWSALPYSSHPIAVAAMLDTDDEKIIGYLHDVCEDCEGYGLGRIMDNSAFWLVTPGIHNERNISLTYDQYCALSLLTHDKDVPYLTYIKEITHKQFIPGLINFRPNKLACKSKISDITHNMSSNPSDKARAKYLSAIPIILKAL